MSNLHGNAMVNDDGNVFQPATLADAQRIEAEHGARIASPDRWTLGWCPVTTVFELETYPHARNHVQCRRVYGHSGEHRAEVSWE